MPKRNDLPEDEMLMDYIGGMQLPEVAKKYGVEASTVRRRIGHRPAYKAKAKSNRQKSNSNRKIRPETIRDIHSMIAKGMSVQEICRETGVGVTSVRKYISTEYPRYESYHREHRPMGRSWRYAAAESSEKERAYNPHMFCYWT